jgi:hypothetical protein
VLALLAPKSYTATAPRCRRVWDTKMHSKQCNPDRVKANAKAVVMAGVQGAESLSGVRSRTSVGG